MNELHGNDVEIEGILHFGFEDVAGSVPCSHEKFKSNPSILLRATVTSPTPRSDSRNTAATLPPARSTARISLAYSASFYP